MGFCGGSKNLHMNAILNAGGFCPGATIFTKIKVTNNSYKNIDQFIVKFVKVSSPL